MELYQLSYFVEVARQRNFTRAAERLHIAQSALSQQMRHLEEELGAPLFIRGRRQTVLTTAGGAFLPRAAALLTLADEARQAVGEVAQLRRGRLVIATIQTLSSRWLPPAIRRFRQKYPFIELVLREENSEKVAGMVETSVAELGFLQLPVNEKQFEITPLFTESFVVLLPRGHALARQTSLNLRQLADEPFIFYKGKAHSVVLDACRAEGFEPREACETGELETVRVLVRAGLGLAILPRLAVTSPSKQFAMLRLREPKLERTVGMVTRRTPTLSAAAKAFIAETGLTS